VVTLAVASKWTTY